MTIETAVLFGVLFAVMLFGFGLVIGGLLLLSRETSKMPEIIARMNNVEKMCEQLLADVGIELNRPAQEIWRTADGKYEAKSFEELLHHMASDPNGPLSSDEIDAIKSVFEKIMQNPDEDDDDTPKEPWQRGK